MPSFGCVREFAAGQGFERYFVIQKYAAQRREICVVKEFGEKLLTLCEKPAHALGGCSIIGHVCVSLAEIG